MKYDIILTIRCKYVPIYYRFRDITIIAQYCKFVIPHLYSSQFQRPHSAWPLRIYAQYLHHWNLWRRGCLSAAYTPCSKKVSCLMLLLWQM